MAWTKHALSHTQSSHSDFTSPCRAYLNRSGNNLGSRSPHKIPSVLGVCVQAAALNSPLLLTLTTMLPEKLQQLYWSANHSAATACFTNFVFWVARSKITRSRLEMPLLPCSRAYTILIWVMTAQCGPLRANVMDIDQFWLSWLYLAHVDFFPLPLFKGISRRWHCTASMKCLGVVGQCKVRTYCIYLSTAAWSIKPARDCQVW